MNTQKTLTFILGLCVILLFVGLMPIHGEENIYSSVIRLHVIANSDSEEDQALKLMVRDRILAESSAVTARCGDIDEAERELSLIKDELEAAARDTIEAEGFSYPVSILIGRERYPARSYSELCFPSGEYLSVRVVIGNGVGQNWWCVLFPPLCLSAAGGYEETSPALPVGFTGEEYKIITDSADTKYKVRFKILEIIEEAISA